MKIGIVTLVSDNYGNKFQNYAVEQLLSEYGQVVTYRVQEQPRTAADHQPHALWQKLKPSYIAEVLRYRMMYRYDITNTVRSIPGNLAYIAVHKNQLLAAQKERKEKFRAFQERYLHISDRIITRENCYDKGWVDSHDFFVCGSDQIWNPTYTTTSELAFLSFAPGIAVALAPSFGLSELPMDAEEKYRNWLNGITCLSVREKAGARIIRELTGREATILLDPTMAIEPEHWETLAREPVTSLPEKYILTYFLGRVTKNYAKRIREMSRETGLPVVNLFNIEEPERYVFDPGEVLYAIRNAELVLTDSFHGTVFSILFRRDFLVFPRDEGGKSMHSRLETLLRKLMLEDRLDDGAVHPGSIGVEKWEKIQEIINSEQERTKTYLQQAFCGK